jgi:hypothetical protein
MSVRITTLDSQVWYLRQGLDISDFEQLFGSYDANIDRITEMLREENDALLEYLSEIEHVILDEAQDLVGNRAELLCELIRKVPVSCGFSVFADSAQAIYGFTHDAGTSGKGRPTEFVNELRTGTYGEITERHLEKIYRTEDAGKLAEKYRDLRRLTLERDKNAIVKRDELHEKTQKAADNALPNVVKQDLQDRADTLVLFRYRGNVLQASSFLWGEGVPHKLRMSGTPQRLAPWIARIFWDFEEPLISASEFEQRWKGRVAENPNFGVLEHEHAWKSLQYYCGTRRGSVEMKQLRRVLSRSRPPIEFTLPDSMLPGPTLGTIHASKGREADNVHLMLPADYYDEGRTEEQIDEEGRVIFVGATRARSTLNVGIARRPFAETVPNGRRAFKLGRKNKTPRAQVEIGIDGDIDKYSLLSSEEREEGTEEPDDIQQYLWDNCLSHVDVYAEKSADTGWEYWIHAEDGSCDWLGSFSKSLTGDFFPIGDRVKERFSRKKAYPGSTIRYLHMVGAESVVLSENDDLKLRLLAPWSSTGIYLIPVVSGFTNVYFNG